MYSLVVSAVARKRVTFSCKQVSRSHGKELSPEIIQRRRRVVTSSPNELSDEPEPSRGRANIVVDTRVATRSISSNTRSRRLLDSDESDISTASTRNNNNRSSCSNNSITSSSNEWLDSKNSEQYKTEFVCPFCGFDCRKANYLGRHMKFSCTKNPQSQYNDEKKKRPFQCECGRQFTKMKLLNYHIRHECQKSVICKFCNQTMIGSSVSKRHIARCMERYKLKKKQSSEKQPEASNSQTISSESVDISD